MNRRLLAMSGSALIVLAVVLVVSRLGTAASPPEDASAGAVFVDDDGDGVVVTVVGAASSGLFACDRLRLADAGAQGSQYVIDVQRSPVALGCNDDLVPRSVQLRLAGRELDGISSVAVQQDGLLLGTHVINR